jgi:hypothetical protein
LSTFELTNYEFLNMKNVFIFGTLLASFAIVSCKENIPSPIAPDSTKAQDSTYIGAIEPAEDKYIFVEELSGVKCSNCPEGAEYLESLKDAHKLNIVTIHAGSLTSPIAGKSIQDFRTTDGNSIMTQIYNGADPSKPCSAFDRQEIITGQSLNKWFAEGSNKWLNAIGEVKTISNTTPVNIAITSSPKADKTGYDVEVKVKYTKSYTGNHALHLYLTEDNITEWHQYSEQRKEEIVFNHVFRKSLTPVATGKVILDTMATKEAGTVYVYRTSVVPNKEDAKEKYWNIDNLHLTAFVSNTTNKSIVHSKAAALK